MLVHASHIAAVGEACLIVTNPHDGGGATVTIRLEVA